MISCIVDTLTFEFEDSWTVSKYDDWSFYRNRFSRIKNGISAVDIVAVSPGRGAWLIEAKDYRKSRQVKSDELINALVEKVLDTLAAMIPAKINGDVDRETFVATKVSSATALRIVFHIEQQANESRIRPRMVIPNLQEKLRQKLKWIDPHLLVVEMDNMRGLPWRVN